MWRRRYVGLVWCCTFSLLPTWLDAVQCLSRGHASLHLIRAFQLMPRMSSSGSASGRPDEVSRNEGRQETRLQQPRVRFRDICNPLLEDIPRCVVTRWVPPYRLIPGSYEGNGAM